MTTTTSNTRRLSDTEYLARYVAEVREYVERVEEYISADADAYGWLEYGSVSQEIDLWGEVLKQDTARLRSKVLSYRHWLKHRTGSATLYTVNAEGQRVEWRADG